MLGYKIAKSFGKRVVITLEIPEDAITNVNRKNIVNAETAKYRTMKAKVIKIEDSDGKTYNEAVSFNYDKNSITYKLDEELVCHDFDMNLENACGAGIHFVLSKSLAETYGLVRIENGILTAWHNNGVKARDTTFVDNKPQGLDTCWYENGNKTHEYNALNDKKDGLCIEWYENGNKKVEYTIVNGKLDGLNTDWYENGNKKKEFILVNGNLDGLSNQWYENGKNKCECTFINGILHGLHTEWYENGNKQKESTFVNGKLDGLFTEWNEKGDKTREYNYGNKHDNEEQPAICCIIA